MNAIPLKFYFHKTACLEFDGTLWWNMDPFEGLWVLGNASGSLLGFKNTKIAELQAVTLAQLVDNLVQKSLYDLLDHYPLVPGEVSDPVYNLLLRFSS